MLFPHSDALLHFAGSFWPCFGYQKKMACVSCFCFENLTVNFEKIMLQGPAKYGQRCLVHFKTNYVTSCLCPDITQVIVSNIE